jgi:hypothetical protein
VYLLHNTAQATLFSVVPPTIRNFSADFVFERSITKGVA